MTEKKFVILNLFYKAETLKKYSINQFSMLNFQLKTPNYKTLAIALMQSIAYRNLTQPNAHTPSIRHQEFSGKPGNLSHNKL